MPTEITMPKLGLTMTTGTIVRWMKAPGEQIAQGEPLLEVSTEKISYEVESPVAGKLAQTIGNVGDEFAPGAVIGIVVPEGDVHVAAQVAPSGVPAAEPAAPARPEARPEPVRVGSTNGSAGLGGTRTIASPAARKLARERSIDVREVRGSGPRGRITLDDVAGYAPSARTAAASPPAPGTYPPELPAARRTIFRRMSEIALLPLAQVETLANVDALRALMERRGDFGWTAFAVFATARLLRDHPELRTDARTGAPHPRCDVGVAADTPSGLLVPVVRDAERRTLRETHDEIVRLARAARDGKLDPADFGEAAFTISNVGPQGVERVVPLVDPPQTAILGMGAATRRPSVVKEPGTNREIVAPAWAMTLVLSFDHRFIDGAPAARFLSTLAAHLTYPGNLL